MSIVHHHLSACPRAALRRVTHSYRGPMDIGMSLPTMARGFGRPTMAEWSRAIDAGPFSSISCGERVTFHNPEIMVTLGAAAALTERVRVFANLVVTPMHPPALVAKQVATLQVLSDGRLTVGVGVGGREHDYRSMGVPFQRRHERLDRDVAEIGRLLAGEAAFDGADPVGPPLAFTEPASGEGLATGASPLHPWGVELLAGAMGPKGLARAAKWADGVSGFCLGGSGEEVIRAADLARDAWERAGRERPPRLVSGCFYALGVPEPRETLRGFTYDYLEVFGSEFARSMADEAAMWDARRLRGLLDEAAAAGIDEFILVPATVDPACLHAATALVDSWRPAH